ncbi:MAG: ZIP family metal transporter [Candidatus Aenigmatarchaeota archaeon]|nr:MAG: ZIP family metal transporter [Candidatus Aenigmarchaeota archaeon]
MRDMGVLLWIIIVTFLVSIISFIGILTLLIREKLLEKIILALVALSAGALMGGAFLHLIPEAVEEIKHANVFSFVLLGFILFFFVEKILHWRHCHKGKCPVHTFAYINLIGDGVHNFIDGVIIAAAFLMNTHLGIATSVSIALHEIPQELGDFGVLVYAGLKKIRALILNFLCAITAIFGGIFGYTIGYSNYITLLLPFAAGGFIYIAASDLIPEIRKEKDIKKSLSTFAIFILGILIMSLIK